MATNNIHCIGSLTLNPKEIRYLRDLLQNPLGDTSETEEENSIRTELCKALTEILDVIDVRADGA